MDLTPTEVPVRRRRSRRAYVALLAVLGGLSVVVWQGLSSASLYFYNADEAVEQRDHLGDRRFRLQGTVLGSSVEQTGEGVDFTVAYNGVQVDAQHRGDPPELFEPGIPVVLEGRWDPSGAYFASDRILVKHSEQYEAENEVRLEDAEDGRSAGAGADAEP
ncbi:MAG: cytochrome c maturation protein CcmE [Acidimicrobiales bacterium]|nr:cytochrome c maturation protein CcmE [Acidimicrobiales bacterium]